VARTGKHICLMVGKVVLGSGLFGWVPDGFGGSFMGPCVHSPACLRLGHHHWSHVFTAFAVFSFARFLN